MTAALGAVLVYLLMVVGSLSMGWALAEKLALRTFLVWELAVVYGGAVVVGVFIRGQL